MAVNQMEGGGGVYKKPSRGVGKKPKGSGQHRTSPVAITGPVSRELEQARKSLAPKVYDVYGSGKSGGGSGRGGYGGYGGGGGYRGYSSQSSYYAAQQAAQQAEYDRQRKEAEAQRKKEIERARAEAKASLNTQLALIDRAIKSVNTQYSADRADWTGRGDAAAGDVRDVYGQMLGDTQGMNQAALQQLAAGQSAAQAQDQSLISAIVGRNNETQSELSAIMNSMGLGKATAQDQVEADSSLALAEMLARGQASQTVSDFGMNRGAQQAVGNWNVSGQQTDRQRSLEDISYQINDMLRQLQRDRDKGLTEQESRRIAAQGEYDATIKGLAQL